MAELLRFCAAGGVSFLVDYGLMCFLTELCGLRYLYSAGLSFTAALALNYRLCRSFVFRTARRESWRERTLFFGASLAGLLLNQLGMWLLVETFRLHYTIAKIFVTAAVTVWNYAAKRCALAGGGA